MFVCRAALSRLAPGRRYSVVLDATRECFVQDLENGLSKIVLNRPERMNSLGKVLLSQLAECIDYVHNKRVVVIRSNCEKAFCSGADLKERMDMNVQETEKFVDCLRSTFDHLASIDPPTIACIDGIALGGGLELALACDIRIAHTRSKVGLPETKLAIFPAAGGTQRLLWLTGPAKAKELIFTAEILAAEDAHRFGTMVLAHVFAAFNEVGILNHIHEQPEVKADEIAVKILSNGPLGVAGAKKAINSQLQALLSMGLSFEKLHYAQILQSQDRVEGLRSFNEKRAPIYKGQ